MASSKGYLEFVLEQLSGLEGIHYRAMMGEYILYYRGKIFGGIYDDRLLFKPAAAPWIRDPVYEYPYEGGKKMLLIENVDDRAFLISLIQAVYDHLPSPAPKKKKQKDP